MLAHIDSSSSSNAWQIPMDGYKLGCSADQELVSNYESLSDVLKLLEGVDYDDELPSLDCQSANFSDPLMLECEDESNEVSHLSSANLSKSEIFERGFKRIYDHFSSQIKQNKAAAAGPCTLESSSSSRGNLGGSKKHSLSKGQSESLVDDYPSKRRNCALSDIDKGSYTADMDRVQHHGECKPKVKTPNKVMAHYKSGLLEAGFHIGSRFRSDEKKSKYTASLTKAASDQQKKKPCSTEGRQVIKDLKSNSDHQSADHGFQKSMRVATLDTGHVSAAGTARCKVRKLSLATSTGKIVRDNDGGLVDTNQQKITACEDNDDGGFLCDVKRVMLMMMGDQQAAAYSSPISTQNDTYSMEIEHSLAFRRFMERRKDRLKEGDHNDEAVINEGISEKSRGISLINLMLLCASAVEKRETQAAAMVLGELCRRAAHRGNTMERLAVYFSEGLAARLVSRSSVAFTSLMMEQPSANPHVIHSNDIINQTPTFRFGHLVANQVIAEAVQCIRAKVHIVDFSCGLARADQWGSLLRLFAARDGGPPRVVRITFVQDKDDHPNVDMDYQRREKELCDIAQKLGMQLQLERIAEEELSMLVAHERGGAGAGVVVNCVLQLNRLLSDQGGGRMARLLACVRELRPVVMTMVEQEVDLNAPTFLVRFVEALHYYAALFDALEASMAGPEQRAVIEQTLMAAKIKDVLALEGPDRRERSETSASWKLRLERAGLARTGLSLTTISQTQILLLHLGHLIPRQLHHGFRLIAQQGSLSLAWKDKPLVTASAWVCPQYHQQRQYQYQYY